MKKPIRRWLLVLVIVFAGSYLWTQRFGVPEHFVDPADEFRYGSIGADHPMAMAPIPYWIWKALPMVAPPSKIIPKMYAQPWNGKEGFKAFGLVTEDQMPEVLAGDDSQKHFERPIGFSRRTVYGMDFVGVNCSLCHLTTFRSEPGAELQTVLAGTGNAVNIEQYFLYMFNVMGDKELFDTDKVMDAVDVALAQQDESLSLVQRLLYRYVLIPVALPKILAVRKKEYFDFLTPEDGPNRLNTFGPGRVDTWAVYKRLYVDPPQRQKVEGIVDFPPFWNLKAREGMLMHWDGNISAPIERNVVSALAVIGPNVEYLDFPRVQRIADFAEELMPPRYADRVPASQPGIRHDLLPVGERVFRENCATCHAQDGDRTGTVERLEDIGTDDQRHLDFSIDLANGLNHLQTDEWELRYFAPQQGYINGLLDGIWLRAPYLHNGSVPTLRDLLKRPANRPTEFCTGNTVYDWENVGFIAATDSTNAESPCGYFFHYKTSVTGNSNQGHFYGTDLENSEKDALIEFLKTL
jgi:mono/diheme cytochrome c family protein